MPLDSALLECLLPGPLNLPFSCVPDSFFLSPRHLLSTSSFFASVSNLSPPAALRPSILPPHRPLRQDFARSVLLLTYDVARLLFLHWLAPPPLFNLRRLCILRNNSYTVLRTFTIPFFYQRKSCLFLEHVL